ncbi:hypothetical protein [Peribacillus simplex]|nr:hypothetical protein [Peribacillus simplex]
MDCFSNEGIPIISYESSSNKAPKASINNKQTGIAIIFPSMLPKPKMIAN